MTFAEEQAFQQARARIERNLAEIAGMARDGRIPQSEFFQRFLTLTLGAVDAMGGAIWSVEGERAQVVAEVSFASSGYPSPAQKAWIDRVLSHTVSTGKSCIVAVQDAAPAEPGGVGNEVPHPFFYTPVVLDGKVHLILQIWLKQAGDPRAYGDIAAFLDGLAHHACLYVRGLQQAALVERDVSSRNMMRLQSELLGELDPKILCETAANYLVDLLGCSLAAVFRRKGSRWQLVAASNQEVVDPKAAQSLALSEAAAIVPDTDSGGIHPSSPVSGEVDAALASAAYKAAAWCHLAPSKNAGRQILLLGCWTEPPRDMEAARRVTHWAAGQLAKALDAATHFHHIPFRPIVSRAGRVLRAWNEDRRRRVLTWVVAPVVLLLGALLFPVPYKIKAECMVVPQRTSTVVAETQGRIVSVLAPEGAVVKAGQELARLEDTDQSAQLAISAQQLARWRVEAARAQTLGNEAERKIAELAAQREEENIRRLEYLRSRTILRSPIDGVVLTRNVQQREGEAMDAGKVFCEVGSLDAYDLQIDLRQQDLGPVLRVLREGGVLPVDFILHAHSRQPLQADLSSANQVSQLPETRRAETVFTARVPLPDTPLEGGVKAGYTGKASILLGRRPWGWLLIRPFREYWRMNWSL
jgi:multidrug efflux pump subunit AcrA (membrane-fusion protein)